MLWLYFFVPGCIMTLLIGRYLREAFRAENMVNVDAFHKKYLLYDRHGNEVLVPLPKGVRLSSYVVRTSIMAIIFIVVAIFVADKWWVPIVAYIGCELICRILSSLFEFSYGSVLYYLFIILSPMLLIASFITLFL